MAIFRFYLMGGGPPVLLEVDARSIDELGEIVTQRRFIVGRLTVPDHDGFIPGMLIATARIQSVVEAG